LSALSRALNRDQSGNSCKMESQGQRDADNYGVAIVSLVNDLCLHFVIGRDVFLLSTNAMIQNEHSVVISYLCIYVCIYVYIYVYVFICIYVYW
jgi:hypothetical protein